MDTVRSPGEGALSQGDFDGWVAGELAGDFGHLLIHRNGVAVGGTNFTTGQKDINAIVVMANTARVVKTTDGSDGTAVFFQWLEGAGKLVVLAGFSNLVIK